MNSHPPIPRALNHWVIQFPVNFAMLAKQPKELQETKAHVAGLEQKVAAKRKPSLATISCRYRCEDLEFLIQARRAHRMETATRIRQKTGDRDPWTQEELPKIRR